MDPLAWVIAATGAFSAGTAWWLSRRAQAEHTIQERVANKIATDKIHLDETQQALDAYERVNLMHQREIDRMTEQNNLLADLLKGEREHSVTERKINAALIERYRGTIMELLQALLVMKNTSNTGDSAIIDNAMITATEIMKGPIAPVPDGRRVTDPTVTGENPPFRIDTPPPGK
jgi:hypothetical protein